MTRTLNQMSGMPKMRAAFSGWLQNVKLRLITQTVVDGLVTEGVEDIYFKGTVQPLSSQELNLKPEGERAWEWLQIHCMVGAVSLSPDDRIIYNDVTYKVMAKKDYSLNNYIEYHLVKDYEVES